MQALRIVTTYTDGRVEDFTLETANAMIGSDAHCEVRLPLDQAAAEHVFVQLTPAGVVLEARSYQPSPLLNGSPFSRAHLLPDSVLGIGNVRIQIWAVGLASKGQDSGAEKTQSISPITIVALVLAVPALGVIVLNQPAESRLGDAAPPAVPELWGAPVTTCSQTGKAEALAVAQRTYALALGRAERRPFRLHEGVAAVSLFEEAGACFSAAAEPEAAKVMAAEAAKLRKELQEDYRTHRARLEHALDVEDYPTVGKEARALLDLISDQEGEYPTYLASLERQVSLRFGSAE